MSALSSGTTAYNLPVSAQCAIQRRATSTKAGPTSRGGRRRSKQHCLCDLSDLSLCNLCGQALGALHGFVEHTLSRRTRPTPRAGEAFRSHEACGNRNMRTTHQRTQPCNTRRRRSASRSQLTHEEGQRAPHHKGAKHAMYPCERTRSATTAHRSSPAWWTRRL